MKRLMITGGAGFIGSNFTRYILERYPDYFVLVYDKMTYAGNLDNLKGVAERFSGRYAFAQADICDAAAVEDAIRSHQIDTIVNFAAESVTPDTFIPVHLGHSIRLETIEELYERYAQEAKVVVDERGTEIVPVKGVLKALSFRHGMGIWSPVTHITRHLYEGEVITLSQKWGRVTVTPNHSVYNADAQLVSAASNPELLSIRKINVDRSRFKDKFTLRLRGCSPDEDENRIYYGLKKYPAPKRVWVHRTYTGELLEGLLLFLGAYIAEGNATYNKANGGWLVAISNQDVTFLEEIREAVSRFSNASGVITQRPKPNAHHLVFSSRIIYELVTRLCGRGASKKRVPSFVYMLQDKYKQILLDTYLRGDGNVEEYLSVDSRRFTTISPRLAAGMGLLLSLMDLDYSLHARDFEKENWSRAYTFRLVSSYDSRVHLNTERTSYQGYVYDLTVENTHNFAAGIGNVVVHNTHVDRSIMNPDAFIQTDVYGTYVLLEAARKFELERYHQIGTDEVYGHVPVGASKETDTIAPRSPYAASKASGDLMVNAYFVTYDLPVTITRGANNIGPYQYPEKVVPLFVTNAMDDEPLPLYGDGLQVRDYQYVLDHCEAIDLVLRKGRLGEVYNIGTGTEMPNIEMTHLILKLLGKPESLIRHVPDREGHDRRYSLDVNKIRALGWEPDHSCAEAIELTVRWYVENEWWWRKIKSGEYKEYYQRQYGWRLAQA